MKRVADVPQAASTGRFILIGSALLLPTVSLLPLGAIYLWDNGWVLWWSLACLIAAAVVITLDRWLNRPPTGFKEQSAPYGDRLTLAQFRSIYRHRDAFELVEKAYDIWRVIRLANPATAVTGEQAKHETGSRGLLFHGDANKSRCGWLEHLSKKRRIADFA